MSTYKLLYSDEQIQSKVSQCAAWIDVVCGSADDCIICPILQSSYYFISDISRRINCQPYIDFFGATRYMEDGTTEDFYIYKSVDATLLSRKKVIIIDVLCSTGFTLKHTAKFLSQFGTRKVYTASLLKRQFTTFTPDWVGYTISDESVRGYGLDAGGRGRCLSYIEYE